ncbi:MAG: hypothetical protein ACI909_001986 [Planctomycetota bacterium]
MICYLRKAVIKNALVIPTGALAKKALVIPIGALVNKIVVIPTGALAKRRDLKDLASFGKTLERCSRHVYTSHFHVVVHCGRGDNSPSACSGVIHS